MYALRFGTPPVATSVGGLKDTIVPWPNPEATGFTFEPAESEPFFQAIRQAVELFDDKRSWRAMLRRAMLADFSWEASANQYLDMYRDLGAWL